MAEVEREGPASVEALLKKWRYEIATRRNSVLGHEQDTACARIMGALGQLEMCATALEHELACGARASTGEPDRECIVCHQQADSPVSSRNPALTICRECLVREGPASVEALANIVCAVLDATDGISDDLLPIERNVALPGVAYKLAVSLARHGVALASGARVSTGEPPPQCPKCGAIIGAPSILGPNATRGPVHIKGPPSPEGAPPLPTCPKCGRHGFGVTSVLGLYDCLHCDAHDLTVNQLWGAPPRAPEGATT